MAALYEIKQIIANLSACYPDWKPSNLEETVQQYEDALKNYPLALLERAADRCRDACLFFPKIAEIKKAIAEIRSADAPTSQYSDDSWKDKKWEPISPEIQKYLDDFRQKMVKKGMWKEGRPRPA